MAEEVTANSPMTKVVNRWKTASPILLLLESTETNFSQHFGAPSGDRCLQILISKSFELLDSPQTKDYAARDALNFLISEIDLLKENHIAALCIEIMDRIKEQSTTKCIDVLPQLLSILPDSSRLFIEATQTDDERTIAGCDFKDETMKKLCQMKWSTSLCNRLLQTLADAPITDSHLDLIVSKMARVLQDIDIQDISSVIFQLLVFSCKGRRKQILSTIMAYFGTMNERLASPASHIDECSFRSVESTVLYHINYAAKQEHELGLDILRAFKTDRDLINSFSVSLILSLTKMHRFESNAIECLKMAVISDIKMSLQKSASEAHKPITESSILSALKQVVYGREELYPSFVQLGVSLLEVQKSITPTDQEHNTQSPTEKACLFGHRLLLEVYFASEPSRESILEQICLRFLTASSTVPRFLRLLQEITRRKPSSLLDHVAKIKDTANYLSVLPHVHGVAFLQALNPLLMSSTVVLDYVLLVLKKALYSRELSSRMIGTSGFALILRLGAHRMGGEGGSQTRLAQSEGSQLETLGNLRRALGLQSSVREIFYEGIQVVFEEDLSLSEHILDILGEQLMTVYDPNETVCPLPLSSKAIDTSSDPPKIIEAVPHLISCIQRCVCLVLRLDLGVKNSASFKALKHQMDRLVDRMLKTSPEEFDLPKSANYSSSLPDGRVNLLVASLLSSTYEVLVEYLLLLTPSREIDASKMLELNQELLSYAKDKKEKKDKNKTGKDAPTPLISFQSSALMLQVALGQNSRQKDYIASKSDLKMFILRRTLEQSKILFSKVDGFDDDLYLINFCTKTGELAYQDFSRALESRRESARVDMEFARVALEILENIIRYLHLHQNQTRVVGFILKLLGEGSSATQVVAADKVSKFLLALETQLETLLSVDCEGHGVIVVGIISLLLKHVTHDLIARHYRIIDKICLKTPMTKPELVSSLTRLHMLLSRQSGALVELQYAFCVHSLLHGISPDVEVEAPGTVYKIITEDNVNICAASIIHSVGRSLAEVEEQVNAMKAFVGKDSEAKQQEGIAIVEFEEEIYPAMQEVATIYDVLICTALDKGSSDLVLKSLIDFYRILGFTAKMYVGSSRQLSRKFKELVMATGTKLTPNAYAFMSHVEKLNRESNGSVAREARLLPSLVYMIEQYESLLIKISRKHKINLLRNFKRSTARDFRITSANIEKLGKNDSDDEEKGGKKPKKRAKESRDPDAEA